MQNQLDPNIVNLTKAIRQTESGGNFQAQGKSGEYGAYQFTEPTWNKLAQQYLGQKVSLQQSTPQQQNEVAYKQVADWKSKGYNVGQVASMWNAGAGEPDAYTGTFSNGKPSVGTNSYGVKYSVPDYAKSVASAYQQLKAGQQVGIDPNNPSSVGASQVSQQTPQPSQDWLQKIGGVVNSIFPGQQIGEAIGTQIAKSNATEAEKPYVTPGPSTTQVLGDVAQAGLMLTPLGAPESALGRLALNTGIGAGFGATQAVKQGSTDLGQIGQSTLAGGGIGLLTGGVGELINQAAQRLPRRITESVLPKLNPEATDYATNNIKMGSVDSNLAQSQERLASYKSQVSAILTDPELKGITLNANDILPNIYEKYPDITLTPSQILDKIKSTIPNSAGMIDQLAAESKYPIQGGLNLEDTNKLRSLLDANTYKLNTDSPEVKAGKDLAATFGNALRDAVKTKATEAGFPEIVPIFDKYHQEIYLAKQLNKLSKQGKKLLSFTDILAAVAGSHFGAPVALGSIALERAATSPGVALSAARTAKLLQPLGQATGKITQFAGGVAGKLGANANSQELTKK